MTLKNVQRYTISLPKKTIQLLEVKIPKNKRSKFIAEVIEERLERVEKKVTAGEIHEFWSTLNKKYPFIEPMDQTTEELIREDRMSH